MIDRSRRWVVLTLIVAVTILAGALVLYTEHALAGGLALIAASLVLASMWIWRTEATKQALRTILWVLIWFVTGGGSRGGG